MCFHIFYWTFYIFCFSMMYSQLRIFIHTDLFFEIPAAWLTPGLGVSPGWLIDWWDAILFILIIPCMKKGSTFMGIELKYPNFANYLVCLLSVLTSQRQGLYIHIFLVHCCIACFLLPTWCLMDTYRLNEYVNVSIHCKMRRGNWSRREDLCIIYKVLRFFSS